MSSNMILVDIKALSGKPIPDWVYALDAHLQGQPPLVRFWCSACLVAMTTTGRFPNGSLGDFITSVRDGGLCQRKGNYGVCVRCGDDKKGGCGEVLPHFRRAVNVFQYLVESAHRKTGELINAGGDGSSEEKVLALPDVHARWVRAFDYLRILAPAFSEHKAAVKREMAAAGMGKEGGNLEWEKARQVSKTYNLERMNLGLSGSGRNAPANVVVDAEIEKNFGRKGVANNQEKRGYYYGNVAADAVAPYSSPAKQRFSGDDAFSLGGLGLGGN